MEWKKWNRYYIKILDDFNYSRMEDEHSARILSELLENDLETVLIDLKKIVNGKSLIIFGGAFPQVRAFLKKKRPLVPIIAVDGVTSVLMKRNVVPDIIVTDLDGKISDIIEANKQGAIIVIHAHGDNIDAVKKCVPHFKGKVVGTTQSKPLLNIYNFGGFTDGDRAVFLATHFGAKSMILVGFNFAKPYGERSSLSRKIKLKKLKWAKKLIKIAKRNDIEIMFQPN